MASSSSRPSQLLKHVFVGSKNDAKQKELLQSLKISHILNCTPTRKMDPEAGCPNYFEKEQTFKYLRIPIFDNKGENLLSHLPTAFKFIEESMHYGGVLIHCHKGVSRSASVAIAYLMMKNKFTVDEAIDYVKLCRPIISPNVSFISQLKEYQKTLESQEESSGDGKSGGGAAEVDCIGPSLPPPSCSFPSIPTPQDTLPQSTASEETIEEAGESETRDEEGGRIVKSNGNKDDMNDNDSNNNDSNGSNNVKDEQDETRNLQDDHENAERIKRRRTDDINV